MCVRTPSAEGARIEAPQAPRPEGDRVRCEEGVLLPLGRGLGRLCPSPENF